MIRIRYRVYLPHIKKIFPELPYHRVGLILHRLQSNWAAEEVQSYNNNNQSLYKINLS